jgi:hypothetical protein
MDKSVFIYLGKYIHQHSNSRVEYIYIYLFVCPRLCIHINNVYISLYKHSNSRVEQHTIFFQESIKGSCTYNFKHRECLQLHCFCFLGVASLTSELDLGLDFGESGFLQKEGVELYQN